MCTRPILALTLLLLPGVSRAQPLLSGSGFTWEHVGDSPLDIDGLAFDAAGTLWADGRPIYYLDLSAGWPGTWIELNDDIYAPNILPLGPAGALGRADTILAADNGAIHRTTDAGATWQQVNDLGAFAELIEIPDGPLAGWLLAADSGTMAVSEDRGATWHEADFQTGTSWNPLDDVIGLPSGRVLAGGPNGITVSDDAAHTFHPSSFWEYLRYGAFNFVLVERPEGGQRILATASDQTRPNYRFLASDDDGETWFEMGDILDPDGGSDSGRLLLPLGGSKALLVMYSGSVQVTADAGATWTAVGRLLEPPELSGITSVALSAENRLYVSVSRAGSASEWVYRTQEAVTVANEPAPVPEASSVELQVGPNPSSGTATAVVTLAHPAEVTLAVYDVLGRQVAVLHEGPLGAGQHTLPFSTAAVSSGVYLVRLSIQSGEAPVVIARRFTITR